MKTLSKALSVIYLCTAFTSAPVFAQQSQAIADSDTTAGASVEIAERASQDGERHHPGWHHGPKLTDDQLQKLSDLREGLRERTAAQRNQMHSLKHQLRNLLTAETVDKGQALAIQTKINALHGELANAKLSSRIDAMSIFTPEQRAEFRHHMLAREAFGGGHHHHGGGCGGHGSCGGHGGGHHGFGGGHGGNGGGPSPHGD